MAPKKRGKAQCCACGCCRAVKPSRITNGKSWRCAVLGRPMVFWSTACIVTAARSHAAWRSDLVAALEPYTRSRGCRGVVAAAVNTVQSLINGFGIAQPNLIDTFGVPDECFDPVPLATYMDLLLLGFFEWHLRLGMRDPEPWYQQLLRTFPGREQWLHQKRCTVWALLDTTAIYILAHYVRVLPPSQALLTIVVATVCFNSWRVLHAVFGPSGVPLDTTALKLARRQAHARQEHAGLVLSPTGGLTGSGRLTLGAFAKQLGLQCSTGRNTEHFHIFVGQLYAEHCATNAQASLDALTAIAAGPQDQNEKNSLTLEVLSAQFHLYGLCREHVARLVGVLIPNAYDSSISTFVGERARMGLQRLLKQQYRPKSLTGDIYGAYLQALGWKMRQTLREHTINRVGEDAWSFLANHLPPGIDCVSHLQLNEHNSCEFVKNDDPEARAAKGIRTNATAQFPEWTRAAYPAHGL